MSEISFNKRVIRLGTDNLGIIIPKPSIDAIKLKKGDLLSIKISKVED